MISLDLTMHAKPLMTRVQSSLQRAGLTQTQANRIDERSVELSGPPIAANDRALAVAIARTVPGVVRVAFMTNKSYKAMRAQAKKRA